MKYLLATSVGLACLALHAWADSGTTLLVSVPDQRLVVVQNGLRVAQYGVSTSKFGVGDTPRSFGTPLGALQVAEKIGDGAPQGAVFKARRPTGEVIRPNARGRDPIVTRILRLRGLEARNNRALDRGIYIHGTPEERYIGRPASYGCIRMRSSDVVKIFNSTPVGSKVEIVNMSVSRALREVAVNQYQLVKSGPDNGTPECGEWRGVVGKLEALACPCGELRVPSPTSGPENSSKNDPDRWACTSATTRGRDQCPLATPTLRSRSALT